MYSTVLYVPEEDIGAENDNKGLPRVRKIGKDAAPRMRRTVLYSIVLYCTVLYRTVLYCNVRTQGRYRSRE